MQGFDCDAAAGVDEADAQLADTAYDLVVADLHMPKGGGLELFRRLRERNDPVPVILVTGDPSLGSAIEAMRLSALDYVVKPVADLGHHIRGALSRAGRAAPQAPPFARDAAVKDWADRLRGMRRELSELEDVMRRGTEPVAAPAPAPAYERLSERERQVAGAIAEGRSVSDAAARLLVSTHTVRNHLKAIYRKLGVRSQVELVLALRG